jgi:hypothetical protein
MKTQCGGPTRTWRFTRTAVGGVKARAVVESLNALADHPISLTWLA